MKAITKDIISVFNAKQGDKTGEKISSGVTFDYVEKNMTWLKLSEGRWVNAGSSWQYIELLPEPVPELPPDEPDIPPIPPTGDMPRGLGDFIILKNSMEVYYGLSRPAVINNLSNEIGYPDMWKITPESSKHPMLPPYWGRTKDHFTYMTPEICHWMFRVNVEMYEDITFASDAQYMSFFNGLPKTHQYLLWMNNLLRGNGSHTNTRGSDTCWNPLSQKDRNGKELMLWFQVVTGGKMAKVNSIRTNHYKIDCIKGTGNFKASHPRTNPEHWDIPLITFRQKILSPLGTWDGKSWRHITRHYGQFGGTPYLPMMLPFDDKCMIEKSLCIMLDPYQETPDKFRFANGYS